VSDHVLGIVEVLWSNSATPDGTQDIIGVEGVLQLSALVELGRKGSRAESVFMQVLENVRGNIVAGGGDEDVFNEVSVMAGIGACGARLGVPDRRRRPGSSLVRALASISAIFSCRDTGDLSSLSESEATSLGSGY
jgi:hypothetical protein